MEKVIRLWIVLGGGGGITYSAYVATTKEDALHFFHVVTANEFEDEADPIQALDTALDEGEGDEDYSEAKIMKVYVSVEKLRALIDDPKKYLKGKDNAGYGGTQVSTIDTLI